MSIRTPGRAQGIAPTMLTMQPVKPLVHSRGDALCSPWGKSF
ncbi:MAG TPA: hypothetical protein VK140_13730 [Ktedonobacteraceae bacterium]|nr:hypothetical protein [Ktedonobacteraceae bacterium]